MTTTRLVAEIEGATSGRLIAEERGLGGLTADELVHGVPHAKFINASFAYAKPREPIASIPLNAAPGMRRWQSKPVSPRSAIT